jgi:membrane protease YdiL (CAAX protease family)
MSAGTREAATRHDEAVPWGVLDCLAVLGVTFIAVVAVVNVLALVAVATGLSEQALRLAQMPLPLVLLAAVTAAWVHWRHGAARRLTGPRRGGMRAVLAGVGSGLAAFVVLNVVVGLAIQLGAEALGADVPETQRSLREATRDPQQLPWFVVSAVLVAPLAEELFFRGMLYPALRRSIGVWGGILISAAAFAAAHLVTEGTLGGGALVFVLILPLGILLAWLYERRGTLAVPIALHMTFNLVTMLLMLAATSAA